ncbi:MAG: hypothetical protein NVS1B9_08550 [Solirubrobacteraceae bacterium]
MSVLGQPRGEEASGTSDGVPERFVPAEMQGELVEAEHLARYEWASRLCGGLAVLDAGCGVGYGAAMLKAAGAGEVFAVDISEPVIEVARQGAPAGVQFETGDVTDLHFPDASFDCIVCFEVIEDVSDRSRVLDELARVLRPEGLLLISSPNRERYVPGNPHHVKEYIPAELRAALEQRFSSVSLIPQHVMLASVISTGADERGFDRAAIKRLSAPGSDDEIYTLALAGNGELPDPGPPTVALTHFVELRRWVELYDGQRRVIEAQQTQITELEAFREDHREALELLSTREQQLAELPQLRARAAEAERRAQHAEAALELSESRGAPDPEEVEKLRARLAGTEQTVESLRTSLSWRLTAPLRRFAGGLRRRH